MSLHTITNAISRFNINDEVSALKIEMFISNKRQINYSLMHLFSNYYGSYVATEMPKCEQLINDGILPPVSQLSYFIHFEGGFEIHTMKSIYSPEINEIHNFLVEFGQNTHKHALCGVLIQSTV